jgi:hypothetical protein
MRILDCKLGRTKHWGASSLQDAPQTPIVSFIQPKLNLSALALGKMISHWHPNPQTIIVAILERLMPQQSLEYYRFEQSFTIWHDKITLVGIGIIAYRNAERMDVRPSSAKY